MAEKQENNLENRNAGRQGDSRYLAFLINTTKERMNGIVLWLGNKASGGMPKIQEDGGESSPSEASLPTQEETLQYQKVKSEILKAIDWGHDKTILSLLRENMFHLDIADILIKKGYIAYVISNVDRFVGGDQAFREKLFDTGLKQRYYSSLVFSLDKFTGLNPEVHHKKLVNACIKKGQQTTLIDGLEKIPEVYHQQILDSCVQEQLFGSLTYSLLKFTGLNPETCHKQVFDAYLQYIENGAFDKNTIDIFVSCLHKFTCVEMKTYNKRLITICMRGGAISKLLRKIDTFEGAGEKRGAFFNKIRGRKSDIEVLDRYHELKSIQGLDEIFDFFIENKQKSLIPLIRKLLITKDIGVRTNFKVVTDLMDLSWVENCDPDLVKHYLKEGYDKLSHLIVNNQSCQRFDRFLETTKTFDEKTITQVKSYFADIIEKYFSTIYERKVKQKFISELGLGKTGNLDEILQKSEIIEGFKMYQKTTKNKERFRQILITSIQGNSKFSHKLKNNKAWWRVMKCEVPKIETWQKRNEETFNIGTLAVKADRSKDIEHFVTVANSKLQLLGLSQQSDATNIRKYFNMEVKKNLEKLKMESTLSKEEFESVYNDLLLQIQSINDLFKQTQAKEQTQAKQITHIRIYKETDPAKVLMMGNVVDGSCLSFYSTVGNFWSTATNALDINKGVFYIQDQNGNIIGRVLTAIDNNGKLLRFRMYKKGNIEVDLDRYFNKYIKQLAENIGLGLDGDINNVELLNGEDWYKDPVQSIE